MSDKPTILIVDDEKVNITVLVALLENQYNLLIAKTGEQALERVKGGAKIDLILLDIVLPGIDGYDVCKALQHDPETAKIPVIFITVKGAEEDETRGFNLGAVDYIAKPFSPAITCARVATHIELKQQRDLLEQLNTIDGLTGIANRRRFDEYLKHNIQAAPRTQTPVALLMIDIDHFKQYNDSYGHLAGDECLKKVAEALQACSTRSIDLIARYGGEEFVAILPATDIDGALSVAKVMLKNIEALAIEHTSSSVAPHVTLSIGIAVNTPPDIATDLIKAADSALYQAKHNGRNQVVTSASKRH